MQPNPCPICGHPDAQDRYRKAVQSRYQAGESIASLMHDYGLTWDELQHVLSPGGCDS